MSNWRILHLTQKLWALPVWSSVQGGQLLPVFAGYRLTTLPFLPLNSVPLTTVNHPYWWHHWTGRGWRIMTWKLAPMLMNSLRKLVHREWLERLSTKFICCCLWYDVNRKIQNRTWCYRPEQIHVFLWFWGAWWCLCLWHLCCIDGISCQTNIVYQVSNVNDPGKASCDWLNYKAICPDWYIFASLWWWWMP